MGQLPDFLGSLPAWITAGGMVTLVGVVLTHLRGLRKLKIEARQVDINAVQVDKTDGADIRDHYAEEVRQLREQLNGQGERHRLAQEASDRRHEECVREREILRDQVRALKDLVSGLRRIITQASASRAIRIAGEEPGEIPEDILAAAERVEELFRIMPPEGDKPQ